MLNHETSSTTSDKLPLSRAELTPQTPLIPGQKFYFTGREGVKGLENNYGDRDVTGKSDLRFDIYGDPKFYRTATKGSWQMTVGLSFEVVEVNAANPVWIKIKAEGYDPKSNGEWLNRNDLGGEWLEDRRIGDTQPGIERARTLLDAEAAVDARSWDTPKIIRRLMLASIEKLGLKIPDSPGR